MSKCSLDFRGRVSILFFICLVMRLCFAGRYLDSCDSIDFALGLHDYDLSFLQPHFPGYPVYIVTSLLFFKLFHNDVWSLVLPGVFFGSLTVYPLFLFARELFSERVAILTVVLYLVNPLCWLQAERPTSDAMGLFFVMLSIYFLYCACKFKTSQSLASQSEGHIFIPRCTSERHGWFGDRKYFFLGSLFLSFGLGVRFSYFPFIALWMGVIVYLAIRSMYFERNAILYGLMGFIIGVCLWFVPQIGYVGMHPFWENGLSFSRGHFTDWGGSIITFGGVGRIVCIAKSLWVYGLGGWWNDTTLLRLIPSLIMATALFYTFKHSHFDRKGFFIGVCIIPYMLWVILGQNVTNPRHIMPIMPLILILIAYGLCKTYEKMGKGISEILTLVLVVSTSVLSFKLVIQYHNNIPAPIRLIRYIDRQYDSLSTTIYCGDEKRFFDYYAPQWDVRMIRNVAGLNNDLISSLWKPQNVLAVDTLGGIKEYGIKYPPIIVFEGNPYINGTKEGLSLYKWSGL